MSRLHERLLSEMSLLTKLTATGEGAPSLEEKCRMAEMIRAESPEGSQRLDRMLIGNTAQLREGLNKAQAHLREMKEMLDKLTAPPWHVGVFLRLADMPDGQRAMVQYGSGRRMVQLADGLSPESLETGDEVFFNNEISMVICKSPCGLSQVGETALFGRYTDDGRLVLRWRDDELIVDAAAPLAQIELQQGDRVRVDRAAWLAYEKLERAEGRRFLLKEVPDARPEQVGGQRETLNALLAALTTTLVAPRKAERYRLNGRQAILMEGPPGCGKTLMARVGVSEISRLNGQRCRFAVVKPAEWEDPYVGVTQQNIRNCFQALKEAAEDGFAVLFMDEIESVGRLRGSAVGHHGDKFLAALLAEMDGFVDREGIAIIGATNRKHLCDPALLERFDLEITVDRPDMRGAREIFEVHLPESIPYWPNGRATAQTRREMVDRAVSRLYSPNEDNELCVIKFRDAKTRKITARELISGRSIEQICRAARQAAFLRDVRKEEPGLRVEDVEEAVSASIVRLSTTLSRRNVHAYLPDLPQDVDVVAVEPIARRVGPSHRYLNQG